MISSSQINQMHMYSMQQNASVPMPGMMQQSAPNMGMSQYPPSFNYGMPGYQNPNERVASRMVGAGMGAAQGVVGGLGTASMVAGVASIPLGMAGFGIAGPLAAAGGLTVGAGLGIAGAGLSLANQGMQEQAQVNQIFGNYNFTNAQNPYGRGFSRQQLRTLGRAVSAIDAADPFVTMEDAMQGARAVTKFGMDQGVKNAEELATKVTDLTNTLVKMAKTMGTSIEEAQQVMGMGRAAGFYTADDVMGNTQTFMRMRGLGFTSNQTGQIQTQGAVGSRAMGLTGQAGARFAAGMTEDIALMMQRGSLSREAMMDATGATDPNSAAMMFAQTTQRMFQNTANNPYGQLVIAGLMNKGSDGSFTINQDTLRRMQAGQIGVDELRNLGQRNLATGQDKVNFMEQQDLILGDLMSSEGSTAALIQALKKTADDSGKPFQMLVQQITGMNARDTRLVQEISSQVSDARTERLRNAMAELQVQQQTLNTRQYGTIGGAMQYLKGQFMDALIPYKEAGADLQADLATRFEEMGVGLFNRTVGAYTGRQIGRAQFITTSGQAQELTNTLVASSLAGGDSQLLSMLNVDEERLDRLRGGSTEMTSGERVNLSVRAGGIGLGRALRSSLDREAYERVSEPTKQKIRLLTAKLHKSNDPEEQASILAQMRELASRGSGIGYTAAVRGTQSMDRYGRIHTEGASPESISIEGNEEALDAIIAEAGGELGTMAVLKGRQAGGPGDNQLFSTIRENQDRLAGLATDQMTTSEVSSMFAVVGGGLGLAAGGLLGGLIGLAAGPAGSLAAGAAGAAIGGAVLGAAGAAIGTGIAHLTGLGGKDYQRLIKSGKGVGLLAKAKTPAQMKRIDQIIARAKGGSRDPAEQKRLAVEALRQAYPGLDISSDDVDVYEDVMKNATNATAIDRMTADMNSDEDIYETQYAEQVADVTTTAEEVTDAILVQKSVEQVKAASTTLSRELGEIDPELQGQLDALGLASERLVAGGDLTEFTPEMAKLIQEAADAGLTSDMASGKSAYTQMLARAAERVTLSDTLTEGSGSVNVGKFLEQMGVSVESDFGKIALAKAGASGSLSAEDARDLASQIGAAEFTGLTLEGTAAMNAAARQGKTPAQLAAENTEKAAMMIDALYAHVTGTEPIFPESGIEIYGESPVGGG